MLFNCIAINIHSHISHGVLGFWGFGVLGGLLSRVSLLRATSLMLEDRLPQSLKEIEALVECIQARDAKAAKAISLEHVSNAQKAALGVLEIQLGIE